MAKSIIVKGFINKRNKQLSFTISRKQLKLAESKVGAIESKIKAGERFCVTFKKMKREKQITNGKNN